MDAHQRSRSPWALDDIIEIVGEVGNKLDVIMIPKVDGPWISTISTRYWRNSRPDIG